MFAAQHRLDNLTLLLDLGTVEEKLAAFGWSVEAVPGHDQEALGAALRRGDKKRPRALVARTTFGYGVSFMESKIEWHYLPLDEDSYARALADLEAQAA
jgi:transketolase